MKKLLLAGLAVGALAVGAPTATADHPQDWHAGGCSFATVNDTTPNQALGGQNEWTGQVDILVRTDDGGSPATPTADNVEVRCDLNKNGALFQYDILSASGKAVVAKGGTLKFEAGIADVISICTYVAVDGRPATYHCDDSDTTPIVPEPVQEIIGLAIDTLNNEVFSKIDPTICPVIGARAGQYGPVLIDGEGDIYLFGDTYDHLWWDCPPYEVAP